MNINSDNTFTAPVLIQGKRKFDISVGGEFAGTVSLQRSKNKLDWVDVETYTTPALRIAEAATAWFYRLGFKAGDYTEGTATVAIN